MFLSPQLPFNFISFQTKLWHSDSLRTHRTLSVLSITATMHAFERDYRKIIIILQLQSKRLALIYISKNFISTLSWIFIRSPLCPTSQQSRISGDLQGEPYQQRNKIWRLTIKAVLSQQRLLNYVKCSKRNYFITQNHFMRKPENLLYSTHQNSNKNKKKV
jgi:hypothetical protein